MTPVKKTAKQAEDVKVEAAKTEAPAAEEKAVCNN